MEDKWLFFDPGRSLCHQPIDDAQSQNNDPGGIDITGVQLVKIKNDHFSRNGHEGRSLDELHVDHVIPQIHGDVDEYFDGDEDRHKGPESLQDVIDVQEQERGCNQLFVKHPEDVADPPEDDAGQEEGQHPDRKVNDPLENGDEGLVGGTVRETLR